MLIYSTFLYDMNIYIVGTWVGLELLAPTGKNDGAVQGKRFFKCKSNYGLFIRAAGTVL